MHPSAASWAFDLLILVFLFIGFATRAPIQTWGIIMARTTEIRDCFFKLLYQCETFKFCGLMFLNKRWINCKKIKWISIEQVHNQIWDILSITIGRNTWQMVVKLTICIKTFKSTSLLFAKLAFRFFRWLGWDFFAKFEF